MNSSAAGLNASASVTSLSGAILSENCMRSMVRAAGAGSSASLARTTTARVPSLPATTCVGSRRSPRSASQSR